MWLATLLLALAGLNLAQMAPMGNCMSLTSSNPPCTLAFTPFMAPQIRPISTVYKTMVTNHMNIIDCHLCTVVQVDSNPPAIGPFTTKVTHEILTVTRVGCMVDSTAITRRDVRGYANVEEASSTVTKISVPEIRSPELPDHSVKPRDGLLLSQLSVDELAGMITDSIDPGNPDLRQQAAIYIRQLRSARFAVDLVDSGFELKSLCDQSRTPEVRLRWTDHGYDATRVSNLLCFASVNGLPLNTTYTELQNQFSLTIAALQSLTGPNANVTQVCESVSLPFAEPLHIDGSGIKTYICSNGTNTSTPPLPVPPMTTVFSATTASFGIVTPFVTGDAGPWSNSTGWIWAGTGTAGRVPTATGELGPWANSTSFTSRESAGPTGTRNGNWSESTNFTFATWSAAPGSWSNDSIRTVTGILGSTLSTGGSWIGATSTREEWNSSRAAASAASTDKSGWAAAGSPTITDTAPDSTNGPWGTGGTWTSQGGSWGFNSTAFATGGSISGVTGAWTAHGGTWDFNGTEATSSTPGWVDGSSWTAAGGSWATGNAGLGSNLTGIWSTGGLRTIAVTGVSSGVFSIATANTSFGVQNGTHLPPARTSSFGYPSWTTSIVTGTVSMKD